MKKLISVVVLGFVSQFMSISDAMAVNVCANCYWPTTCGQVTMYHKGYILCGNHHNALGVLWTNKSCSLVGGTYVGDSAVVENMRGNPYKLIKGFSQNPDCQFDG